MSISFGGVITRYISTSTKLKLKSNVVDICEWYRNVCVVQSCMHWDIPNRVPVVPVPIPTPSPLFLSPFPSPSPCYKISLTQSTNHQPVFFMSQNQVKVVGWTSYPSLIPESCLVWSIIRDVHNATSIHLVFLRNFCNYLPDVLSCIAFCVSMSFNALKIAKKIYNYYRGTTAACVPVPAELPWPSSPSPRCYREVCPHYRRVSTVTAVLPDRKSVV